MNWLRYIWQRIRCFFGRHNIVEDIDWTPEFTCLIIGCESCGHMLYHRHFGTAKHKDGVKHPGESRVH